MKIANVILVGLIVVVVAVAGWVAWDYTEKEAELDYAMDGYCHIDGYGTVTITLQNYKDKVTDGYLTDGYGKDPVRFVDGVGEYTYMSSFYEVGPFPISSKNVWLEVEGFTCHRV